MKALILAFVIVIAFHVEATTFFVNINNTNPAPPYTDWSTAATNIQDAIDVTSDGDLVLVTNGVYKFGGRKDDYGSAFGNSLTNRVVITNSISVQSVNGPTLTVIEGNQMPGSVNGLSAVRCVFIEKGLNALLSGFTITNGATFLYSQLANTSSDCSGGGVFCWTPRGVWSPSVISNCIITGCSSGEYGGGACGGIYDSCILSNNSAAFGGGAYFAILTNCFIINNSANLTISSMPNGNLGGGALDSILFNCSIFNNYSATRGGGTCKWSLGGGAFSCIYSNNSSPNGAGTYSGMLTNCTLLNNIGNSSYFGSLYNCILEYSTSTAAYGGSLFNCTVIGNSKGADSCSAYNSIIYYNTTEYSGATLYNCCSRLASATSFIARGNFTNAPLFVNQGAGDFQLQSNSPCINAGANSSVQTASDFDGNQRVAGSFVDVGAFEYQNPLSVLPYFWLQQYGLPNDGSVDHADTDGDGMDNWMEWRCSTDPNDPQSLLEMLPLTNGVPGIYVTWRCVANVSTYFVQRSTNLNGSPAFVTINSNLFGSTSGQKRIWDKGATNNVPYYYRVGIQ